MFFEGYDMTFLEKVSSLFNQKSIDNVKDIKYSAKSTLSMSDEEIKECSELFNCFYGKYNKDSNIRPGEQIRMPVSYYRNNYCKPNFYVALAKLDDKLVGQAFYLRKDYSDQGYGVMTWVLQLVVDDSFRRQGIASTLLRSIWGFSDDYAWGLATTNPCTVKTLESATFRKCKPETVSKYLKAIKTIGDDISFVKDVPYFVSRTNSQIDTEFFVDNHAFVNDDSCEKQLGVLKPGHEWLAFTFRDQGIQKEAYQKHFYDMVNFSERKLKEAYSRMDMPNHTWAKGTSNEVEFIWKYGCNDKVLDLGCGYGRHALELAQRGAMVTAVDFAEKNIEEAKAKASELSLADRCMFSCMDARSYEGNEVYDKVICLYDVVGSFPNEEDNITIIQNAYKHLNIGGYLILSVMNMELIESIVLPKNKGNLYADSDILRKLPPSRTMQSSGDIFNPKYLAVDTVSNLVYRKEQFSDDDGLSAEYVIRDKRYTKGEIISIVEGCGFEVVESRFVRAGHFDECLKNSDTHAKEILIVAKK